MAIAEGTITQIVRPKNKEPRELDQWLVTGEPIGIQINRAMLENGICQTARARPIIRVGGTADYFESRKNALFRMMRPD